MKPICENCAHFNPDPLDVEAAIPGLNVMSSGFASIRAGDGLCAQHERYVPAHASCAQFAEKYTSTP